MTVSYSEEIMQTTQGGNLFHGVPSSYEVARKTIERASRIYVHRLYREGNEPTPESLIQQMITAVEHLKALETDTYSLNLSFHYIGGIVEKSSIESSFKQMEHTRKMFLTESRRSGSLPNATVKAVKDGSGRRKWKIVFQIQATNRVIEILYQLFRENVGERIGINAPESMTRLMPQLTVDRFYSFFSPLLN